jgi:hypothetical protein
MLERDFVLNGAGSGGWLLILSAAALGAAVCIVLLFNYERHLVSRRLGATLLALRLAAVLVVFVALLEPMLVWTFDREQTGRVLVAVDVSESMDTADQHASPAEKLRLARTLGMIGNEATQRRLDRWIEDYESGREPEWVESGETGDPERAAQLARTRRESIEGVLDAVGRMSRKEIAHQLLTGSSQPLVERLDRLAVVELAVFAGDSATTEPQNFRDLVNDPPDSMRADSSDLLQGVEPAIGADDLPLAGVVLFTDGRDNAHDDESDVIRRIGGVNAPLYPVLIGSQQRPKDLAVATLDYPSIVYEHDHPQLIVNLRTAGFENESLTVRLRREDEDDPEAEPLTEAVVPSGPSAAVEFELDAEELGRHRYVVETDVQEGETREDNNRKTFSIHVVDDKSDVLVLEGEGRWEFRYLEAALKRDEHVGLDTVLFRQPYLGLLPQPFFPRQLELPPADGAELPSPFAGYDAIILGDVAPHHLPSGGWEWIDQFVREQGGTLVLVAGKRHFPRSYQSRIVEDLLPIRGLQVVEMTGQGQTGPPTSRGFHLQLTPEGEQQTMLQFDADDVENRRIWNSLPGHLWGLRGEAKPGASVWAALTDPRGDQSLESERQNAMIVHQYVGAGQVLWIGIDSTWRWRYRMGDLYHHMFWGQLARWSAEFKATSGNEFVRFGPERPSIEVGEDALFRARWTERFLRQFPDLQASAEIYPVDALDAPPVMTVELTATDTRPLIHEGRALDLESGDYRVVLKVENADFGGEEVATELLVAERTTTELAELAANRNLLQQMADATEGRLFLPDQLDELPDLFEDVNETESLREEVTLWDHWLTLLIFCSIIGGEWVLRKLNGLP